jgi:hypothetical protein
MVFKTIITIKCEDRTLTIEQADKLGKDLSLFIQKHKFKPEKIYFSYYNEKPKQKRTRNSRKSKTKK